MRRTIAKLIKTNSSLSGQPVSGYHRMKRRWNTLTEKEKVKEKQRMIDFENAVKDYKSDKVDPIYGKQKKDEQK